jgi:hypothetical protein
MTIHVSASKVTGPPLFTMDETRPAADNTGLAVNGIDDASLTLHDGNWSISTDGAVIDGYLIRGLVDLTGDNIILRNCKIVSHNITSFTWDALVRSSGNNNLVENCELTQYDDTQTPAVDNSVYYIVGAKVTGGSCTVRRCDISNINDSLYVTGGTLTAEGNYCHDFGFRTDDTDQSGSSPANWSHNDGCQIMGGTNHNVHGNNFDMRFSTVTGAGPAANPNFVNCHGVLLQGANNTITGVVVDKNWMAYGAICLLASGGSHTGNVATVSNNRFTPNQGQQFSIYQQMSNDPNTSWTLNSTTTNVYSDDADTPEAWRGQPIKAPTVAGTTTTWAFNLNAHTP